MPSELSSINLRYDDRNSIHCQAVNGPDDYTPFNFLEHFPEAEAKDALLDCAQYAARVALKYREEPTEHSIPLSSIEGVPEFVVRNLGVRPIGKLVYVEQLDDRKEWGITNHSIRKSYVIRSSILNGNEHGTLKSHDIQSDIIAGSVAVHELTHLAGLPDWVFFSTNSNKGYRYVNYIDAAPTTTAYDYTRNQQNGGKTGGWFWEEGLATLAGSLYIWKQRPDFAQNRETVVRQAPDGARVHLPVRHTVNKSYQGFAGWGIERLIAIAPRAWDVLIASRVPGATWQSTRSDLKQCLEASAPGLFDRVDQVTGNDLSQIIQTADRIDYEAKRRKV